VEHVVRITEERFAAHVARDRHGAEVLAKLLTAATAMASPAPRSLLAARALTLDMPSPGPLSVGAGFPSTPSRASHIQVWWSSWLIVSLSDVETSPGVGRHDARVCVVGMAGCRRAPPACYDVGIAARFRIAR
jgi:hypothetical protein